MKPGYLGLFTIIIAFLQINLLFPQNYSEALPLVAGEQGYGVRYNGVAGAFTALADDYAALYWNPAGLTELTQSQFYGEFSHQIFSNESKYFGTITDESWRYTRIRSLGFAIPLATTRGSAVIAFGYNRSHEMDYNQLFSGFSTRDNGLYFPEINGNNDTLDFPFNKSVQRQENITNEGSLKMWSVGGGIAMSPHLNLGVSLDYYRGGTNYDLNFLQSDVNNIYSDFPGDYDTYELRQNLNTSYSGWGMKIGLNFSPVSQIQLGMNVTTPITFNVSESWTASDALVYDDGYISNYDLGSGDFEYKIKVPLVFEAGIGMKNEIIRLGASVKYRDWTQFRYDKQADVDLNFDYQSLLDENKNFQNLLRPTVNYRLGGELYLKNLNAVLRAGYAFMPTPYENVPSDWGKTLVTGGVGFKLDEYVSLDLALTRMSWKNESNDVNTPAGTQEKLSKTNILIGITYNFEN